jgi:hypothetical protein
VGYPSLASEFPNDNVEISVGTIWVCTEPTGPARAQLAPYQPVAAEPFVLCFDDDDAYVDGPIEIHVSSSGPTLVVHEDPPMVSEPEPVAPPAFHHFESALVSALMSRGASRAAAVVPQLLRLEALPADALAKDCRLTLQSRGYLEENSRYSDKFRALCGAWTAVLHDDSGDLAACGTTTLDRFGADLLAALLTIPATRAEELRKELRKAGIAAFGVLEAAA